jgi:hypothetical protein
VPVVSRGGNDITLVAWPSDQDGVGGLVPRFRRRFVFVAIAPDLNALDRAGCRPFIPTPGSAPMFGLVLHRYPSFTACLI